jgi:DNA helicase TIP49 (TBP-interacting protein)
MNKEIIQAIKKLQRKLKRGDAITIEKDEYQVTLDGRASNNYSEAEKTHANQMEIAFEMRGF